jgi:hypothetical protein
MKENGECTDEKRICRPSIHGFTAGGLFEVTSVTYLWSAGGKGGFGGVESAERDSIEAVGMPKDDQ